MQSFPLFFFLTIFAQYNEGLENAIRSNLTNVSLPAGAMRVLPANIPAEVNETLEKLISQSNGQLRRGDTEVLLWSGESLRRTGKTNILSRLTNSLKTVGWEYEASEENGVSVFSLLKDGSNRRAVIGFFGELDGTLVFAWTELLKAGSNENSPLENVVKSGVTAPKSSGNLIGTWFNGRVSTVGYQNTITGAITSGGGNRFEYKFGADGKFQFTGYMEVTTYGCTTTLFNLVAGKYSLNNATLNLSQTKNYWKQTSSCSAKSNLEKNNPLVKEIYQISAKLNEYNQETICLTNKNGETCFQKQN